MSEALFSTTFRELVRDRRGGSDVPAETVSISDGEAKVTVRLAGGYITEAVLDDEGEPVSVLYCDPEFRDSQASTQPAKINASHDMSPAGVCDDIGGQHGVYRWADFEVAHRDDRHLEIESVVSEDFLCLHKAISLDDDGLTIATSLSNTTDEVIDTSLGHHLYWNMEPDEIDHPQVLPASGPAPMQNPEVYEAVMSGDSRYWSGFDGKATIVLPGVGRFLLRSHAYITEADGSKSLQPVGLLLWRRPGTDSICFEPVVGNENSTDEPIRPATEVPNRQLFLATGSAITLKTVISVLEAAS